MAVGLCSLGRVGAGEIKAFPGGSGTELEGWVELQSGDSLSRNPEG